MVDSWNEYNPGHVHLREIAERVKQGIRDAGGLPFEVTTTGLCDGMVLKDPRYIELPSRNLIADEVELNVEANMFDGMVLLSTCDSIVPGHLMACARLDIPCAVVTGAVFALRSKSCFILSISSHPFLWPVSFSRPRQPSSICTSTPEKSRVYHGSSISRPGIPAQSSSIDSFPSGSPP